MMNLDIAFGGVTKSWRKVAFGVVSVCALLSLCRINYIHDHDMYIPGDTVERRTRKTRKNKRAVKKAKTTPKTTPQTGKRKKKKRNKRNKTKAKTKPKAKSSVESIKSEKEPEKPSKAVEVKKEVEVPKGYNLVWLMAYPFSGSSVSLNVAQDHTGYSMATNYGHVMQYKTSRTFRTEFFDSIPVDKSSPNGPYKYRYDRPLPPDGSDLLVKTHCSGHCIDTGTSECKFMDYIMPLAQNQKFFVSCASGTMYTTAVPQRWLRRKNVFYDPNMVGKIVLLVRNPIEIVVARFMNVCEGDPTQYKLVNHAGLEQWCKIYDNQRGSRNMKNFWYGVAGKKIAENMICHAEIFRIIKWYERALDIQKVLVDKHITLHFEDWEADYGLTSSKLLDFLDTPIIQNQRGIKAYEQAGGVDHEYFSKDELENIFSFIDTVARPDVKNLLSRYLK